MYNEIVYHLDLCILSYQLYGQTLVWPMDPYYEQMARGGSLRRKTFMREVVHNERINEGEVYRYRLDPILFNYEQINPWLPALVKPENKWDVFNAPTAITDTIKTVHFIKKDPGAATKKINNPSTDESKQIDDLYCFEGETGVIPASGSNPEKKGAKSLMGFVLARQINDAGDYDVHIVFRGSRSGSAERALVEGKFSEMGNPDWVTDTDFGVLVDSEVSGIGRACRGFQASVKKTKDNIKNCLIAIQQDRKKAPNRVYVTGHSLGGALATHYASVLEKGDYIDVEELKKWPLTDIKVFTYGAPVTGDKQFCEYMGVTIPTIRAFIGGDPIIQEKFNMQGRPIRTQQTHAGIVLSLPGVDKGMGKFEAHEPSFIRRALIAWLKQKKLNIKDVPANNIDIKNRNEEPWVICNNLIDVLKHPAFKDDNAKHFGQVLPSFDFNKATDFQGDLYRYTTYFYRTLGYANAYKNPFVTIQKKAKKQEIVMKLLRWQSDVPFTEFELLLKANKKDMDDPISYKLIALCGVLRGLIRKPADAKDLIEGSLYPEITDCIKKI